MDFTVILVVLGCLLGVLAAPTPDVTRAATEDQRLVHDEVTAQRPNNDAVAVETGPKHPVGQSNNAPKTVHREPETDAERAVPKKPVDSETVLEKPTAVTRIPFKEMVAQIERARATKLAEQRVEDEPVAEEAVSPKPVGPNVEHPTKQVGQDRLLFSAVPVEEVPETLAVNSVPVNVEKAAARPAAHVAAQPEAAARPAAPVAAEPAEKAATRPAAHVAAQQEQEAAARLAAHVAAQPQEKAAARPAAHVAAEPEEKAAARPAAHVAAEPAEKAAARPAAHIAAEPEEKNVAEPVARKTAAVSVLKNVPARPVDVPIEAPTTVEKETVSVKPKAVPDDSNAVERVRTDEVENAPAKPRNAEAEPAARAGEAVPDTREHVDTTNDAAKTAAARPIVAESRPENEPISRETVVQESSEGSITGSQKAASESIAHRPVAEERIPAKPLASSTIATKPVIPAAPAAVQSVPSQTLETERAPSSPTVLEVALHAGPKTQESTVADKPIAEARTRAKTETQESDTAERVAQPERTAMKTEDVVVKAIMPDAQERVPAEQTATENIESKPVNVVPDGPELERKVVAKSPTQKIVVPESVDGESPTKPAADRNVQTKPVVEPVDVEAGATEPVANVATERRPTTVETASKVARPATTQPRTEGPAVEHKAKESTTAAASKPASSSRVSDDESSQETVEVVVKPEPIQKQEVNAHGSKAAISNTASAINGARKEVDGTVNPASPNAPEGTRNVPGPEVAANIRERIHEELAVRHKAPTSHSSDEKLPSRINVEINDHSAVTERTQEETRAKIIDAANSVGSTKVKEAPTRTQHTPEPKSPEPLRNPKPEPEESKPQTPQARDVSKPGPEHSDEVAETPVEEPKAVETASSANAAAVSEPEMTGDAPGISQHQPIRASEPESNAREVAPSKTETDEQTHDSSPEVLFPTETQTDTETSHQTISKPKAAEENVRDIVHDMPTFERQVSQKPDESEAAASLTEWEPATEQHASSTSINEERRPYINDAIDHYPKDVVQPPEAAYPKAHVIDETESHEAPVSEPEERTQSTFVSKPEDDTSNLSFPVGMNEETGEKPSLSEHNVYPPSPVEEAVPAEVPNPQENVPVENAEPSVQNAEEWVDHTNSESIPEHEWRSNEPAIETEEEAIDAGSEPVPEPEIPAHEMGQQEEEHAIPHPVYPVPEPTVVRHVETEAPEDPYQENPEQANTIPDWQTTETEASETHNDVPVIPEVVKMENGKPIHIEPTETVTNILPHDHNSFVTSPERSEPKPYSEIIETEETETHADNRVPNGPRVSQIEDDEPKYAEPTSKPELEPTTQSSWSKNRNVVLDSMVSIPDFRSEPDVTTLAPRAEEPEQHVGSPPSTPPGAHEVHDDTMLIGIAGVTPASEEGKSIIEDEVHVIDPTETPHHPAEVTTEAPYAKPEVIPIENVWNNPTETAREPLAKSTDSSSENLPSFNIVRTDAPSIVVDENKNKLEVDTKNPHAQNGHEIDENTEIPNIIAVKTDAPPMLPILNANFEVTSFPEPSEWEREHAKTEMPEVVDINTEAPTRNEVIVNDGLERTTESPIVHVIAPETNEEHPVVNEEHAVVTEKDAYSKSTEESSDISVETEEPIDAVLVPTEANVPEAEPEATEEILHMEPRTDVQENLPGTAPVMTEYPLIHDTNMFTETPVEQGKEPKIFDEEESNSNWQETDKVPNIEVTREPVVEDGRNSTAVSINSEISTSGTMVTDKPKTAETPDAYFPEKPGPTEQNGTVLPTSVGAPKDDKVTELSSQHGPSTFTIVAITVPVLLLMVGIMACGWEYRRNRAHRNSTQSLLNRVEVVPKEQMSSMADFTNPNFEQQLSDEEETVYAKALEIHDDKPVEV